MQPARQVLKVFFTNVGRRNTHVVVEVLPTSVDCQSELVLLIGGGGAICENAATCTALLRSKTIFLGGINLMECVDTDEQTKQQHMLILHDEPCGGLH
jgi:hypothetical protein